MSNKLVAIVDDKLGSEYMISLVFESRGLSVVSYNRGEDLLDRMDVENNLGAVVMDTKIGNNLRGYDVCRLLFRKHPNIPVIGVSADPKDCKKWLSCGAREFVVKPFKVYDVLNKVRSYLD